MRQHGGVNCALFVAVILMICLGCVENAFAQTSRPIVNAFGSGETVAFPQGGNLNISVALDGNGVADNADWWLATVTPVGIFFLTPQGWTTSTEPVYQGPLMDVPTIEILNVPTVGWPAGPYQFFFAVDTVMDGLITPDKLQWSMVTAISSVFPEHSEDSPARIFIPVLAYYLDRYFSRVPTRGGFDSTVASILDASPESRAFFRDFLRWYKDLPAGVKERLYDSATLRIIPSNPSQLLDLDAIRQRVKTVSPVLGTRFGPPAAPSALTARNASSFESGGGTGNAAAYQIELKWQDNSNDEEGFHIYRSFKGSGSPQLHASVGPGITTFTDTIGAAPAAREDEYCYYVAAYKKSLYSLVGQPAELIESVPSETRCSFYAIGYPPPDPLPDADGDGIPDIYDKCPYENGGVYSRQGCPDSDGDGIPDKDDYCPLESGAYPVVYDTSGHIPLPGCPYKYRINWIGMRILNNSMTVVDEKGNVLYNEPHDKFDDRGKHGEEPYLVFSFLNGMQEEGSKTEWTNRWCCGEGVNVANGFDWEPDDDRSGEVEEGSIGLVDPDYGLTVFPGVASEFAPIDAKLGLNMAVTLMERDWTMTVTPDSAEKTIWGQLNLIKGGVSAITQCVGSLGLDCLEKIGSFMKDAYDFVFGASPTAVEVEDKDDYMGTNVWSVTASDVQEKTALSGVYAFYFDMPTTYSVACRGEPCSALNSPAATMRARVYFCLFREGVPTGDVKNLCSANKSVSEQINIQ